MGKRTKKRIKIVLILLVLLMLYRRYCVMNVMDEMILSDQSFLFIPYTRASYAGLDIEYEYAGRPFLDGTWTSDPDLKMIFYYEREEDEIWFYKYQKRMEIEVILPASEHAQFKVIWTYNATTKRFSVDVNAYEVKERRIGVPVTDAKKAETLIKDSGMSAKQMYENAEETMKEFLDEWIQVNEGKSRFSEGHYGWHRKGELEYSWENKNAEWF